MGEADLAGDGVVFEPAVTEFNPIDAVANPVPGNGFMGGFLLIDHANALAQLNFRGKMVRLRVVEMPVTFVRGRVVPVPEVEPVQRVPSRRLDGGTVNE